jgi:subtilisin family serine protease
MPIVPRPVLALLLGHVGLGIAGCGLAPGVPARPAGIHATLSIQAEMTDDCGDVSGDPDACGPGGTWDLAAIGAAQARRSVASPRVVPVVATIDTGADPTHPDLQGILLPLTDLGGDDAYLGPGGPLTFAGRDGNGHGTHVAGTIASVAGRDAVRILPVKAIGHTGTGDDDTIARAIASAVDWRDPADPERRVRAINLSIGGRTSSRQLGDAVRYAAAHDVVVVASSGNRGRGVDFPGTLPEALAVGGSNRQDELADYSNRGPELGLVAPGGDGSKGVYSAWPTYLTAADLRQGRKSVHPHAWMVGTSMAAPHVTGGVALLLAKEPWLSARQIRDRLAASAIDLGPAGPDPYFGAGLLAIDRALALWGSDGR